MHLPRTNVSTEVLLCKDLADLLADLDHTSQCALGRCEELISWAVRTCRSGSHRVSEPVFEHVQFNDLPFVAGEVKWSGL
jgi:hypothetical protein